MDNVDSNNGDRVDNDEHHDVDEDEHDDVLLDEQHALPYNQDNDDSLLVWTH